MKLNVNNKTDAYFDEIDDGECFAYNGSCYIMAYDDVAAERFGVNLSNGTIKSFNENYRVQRLTAEVSFKELS